VHAGGRVFLEVERFDRTRAGRIGMVSLLAYDSEYVGQMDNWAATATRMAARNLMTEDDAQRLRLLEAFGRLIANTDRHYGNISLLIDGGDWRMAPAYDQLPMLYAPVGGAMVEREFDPGEIAPTADTLREWKRARSLAHDFWRFVAADVAISKGFRAMAQAHAARLAGTAKVTRPAAAEPVLLPEQTPAGPSGVR
jgi:serine/threonine protein kinase HipA of HipAB toxin-antitoxin module